MEPLGEVRLPISGAPAQDGLRCRQGPRPPPRSDQGDAWTVSYGKFDLFYKGSHVRVVIFHGSVYNFLVGSFGVHEMRNHIHCFRSILVAPDF